MGNDFLPVAFVWLLAWWVHSSLLLGAAGAISLFRREMSPRSREWLWKSAVVLPFLTAPVQSALGTGLLWRWEVPSVRDAETRPPSGLASTAKNVLPSAPSVSESIPVAPQPIHELPKAPAIAEKPTAFPIIIETVVSDVSSLQTAGHLDQPIPPEEPSPFVALPKPAEIEVPKPAAIGPKATARPLQDVSNQNVQWPWYVPGLVGVVLLLGLAGGTRFLWLLICTSRLIRRSRRLTSGIAHEELQRLLSQSPMRGTIRLAESSECSIPAAGGLFRRVILLPSGIEDRLNREELRALLAHELGHHARHDVWWLWLGRGLCHLLPVQPFYFWAVRQWHRAAEPLCDDWAIARNVSPISLAKSLTQIAQWRIAKPAIGPAATNGPSQLTLRVERLLGRRDAAPRWKRRLLPLLVPLLAGLVLAFAPLVSWSQAETAPSAAGSSAKVLVPDSNRMERITASSLESEPARPTSLQRPPGIPDDIKTDLEALQKDLEQALALLQMSEDDPEIRDAILQLQQRLQDFRDRQSQITNATRVPSP